VLLWGFVKNALKVGAIEQSAIKCDCKFGKPLYNEEICDAIKTNSSYTAKLCGLNSVVIYTHCFFTASANNSKALADG